MAGGDTEEEEEEGLDILLEQPAKKPYKQLLLHVCRPGNW